jgi:hypothetical protein
METPFALSVSTRASLAAARNSRVNAAVPQ